MYLILFDTTIIVFLNITCAIYNTYFILHSKYGFKVGDRVNYLPFYKIEK